MATEKMPRELVQFLAREAIIKRDLSSLPTLNEGHFGWSVDTQQLFIGSATAGNIEVSGGAGAGDVFGPASSIDNAIAVFDGVTGKLIKDSTVLISSLGDVSGPGSSVDENFAMFSGTSGKLIADSGKSVDRFITSPVGSVTDQTIAVWDTSGGIWQLAGSNALATDVSLNNIHRLIINGNPHGVKPYLIDDSPFLDTADWPNTTINCDEVLTGIKGFTANRDQIFIDTTDDAVGLNVRTFDAGVRTIGWKDEIDNAPAGWSGFHTDSRMYVGQQTGEHHLFVGDPGGVAGVLYLGNINVRMANSPDGFQFSAEINVAGDIYADNDIVATGDMVCNSLTERTPAAGVSVGSSLIAQAGVSTDTVDEETPDTGVTVDGLLIKDGEIPSITEVITVDSEPTGFPNRTDSTYYTDDGTMTMSVAPTGASFDVWVKGSKFTKSSAVSAAITDTEGLWYLYIDENGDGQVTQTFSASIAADVALVMVAYWDSTSGTFEYEGEERHGLRMDGDTHAYLHLTVGTAVESGLGLSGIIADGSGNLDTHAQVGKESGVMWDEDIRHALASGAAPQKFNVWYLSGANADWRKESGTNFPVSGGVFGNRINWNEYTGGAWQLTEVGNGKYVLMHFFATNDSSQPYIAIVGQNEYLTKALARDGAVTEMASLYTGDLPFTEFVAVGTVIFQTRDTYTNSVKSRIVTTEDGDDYVNWVGVALSPAAGPADHNNLLNKGTNTHDQIDTHLALVEEHIDWTNATDSLYTTGSIECEDDAFFHGSNMEIDGFLYIDNDVEMTGTFDVDTIDEATLNGGVTVDGVLCKDNEVTADDYLYGTAGVTRTHVIGHNELYGTWNWTGTSSWSAPMASNTYSFLQYTIGTHYVMGLFVVPQDYKTGTDIKVQFGTGVTSGSLTNYNYDVSWIAKLHATNTQAAPTLNKGREYGTAGFASGTLVDQLLYPQTYCNTDQITISSSGSIGSYSIAASDRIIIGFGVDPAASGSPGTSTLGHASHITIEYTATSTKDS